MKMGIRNIKSHQTYKSAIITDLWEQDRIEETKLLIHFQNSSELSLFLQKHNLEAMNFDCPSEKNFISRYIKPTIMKLYQRSADDSEKQSITADDGTS